MTQSETMSTESFGRDPDRRITAPEAADVGSAEPSEGRSTDADQPAGREGRGRRRGRRRGRAPGRRRWDEQRVVEDGGFVVHSEDGEIQLVTPAEVAAGLRYCIAGMLSEGEDQLPRRLAFTSALSGEGVSYITRSFATVLAHDHGRRVCIVDLNWWTRPPGRRGGDPPAGRPGMFEALSDPELIADVLVPTEWSDLWMLPAGRAPISARAKLVHSPTLAHTLELLEEHFDHLIIDAPAVLVASDAVALVGLCGGCVMVTRQRASNRAQIQHALELLRPHHVHGFVLNRVTTAIPPFFQRIIGI